MPIPQDAAMNQNIFPQALPTVFISHGAPTLALAQSATARFLENLSRTLPRPHGVLVISAHKSAPGPELTSGEAPRTLHDFSGFSDSLYALRYPAPGNPALAKRAINLLGSAGFSAQGDPEAPFDHGVWVPMRRMYPTADIPVVALSVSPMRDAGWHYSLGRSLAPLRKEGILIIGSGGLVHNLDALEWRDPHATPAPWAQSFATWMIKHITSGDAAGACDWLWQAPSARQAHPTPEHLLPLFVAWGAAHGPGLTVHEAWEYATLGLHAIQFNGVA